MALAATLALCAVALPRSAEAGRGHWSTKTLAISGTPTTSVVAGSPYSFTPTVSSGGTTVSYSISSKPAWAAFSLATGTLSGTPTATQAGVYSSITITATSGRAKASLAPFSITVTAPVTTASSTTTSTATTNTAPVISGTPPASVLTGSPYSFRPTASDANGDALSFSIAGQPTWATFDAATGLLSGTPTSAQVGSYAGIVITVSDGKSSTSLPAFTVTVNAVVLGSAALSWTPPVQNTDGSSLTDLAGYNLYYGTNSSSLSNKVVLNNPGLTAYTLGNLSSGTYYFGISAYTASGAESALSNVGSKTIL